LLLLLQHLLQLLLLLLLDLHLLFQLFLLLLLELLLLLLLLLLYLLQQGRCFSCCIYRFKELHRQTLCQDISGSFIDNQHAALDTKDCSATTIRCKDGGCTK
jgi:hypothetical protein